MILYSMTATFGKLEHATLKLEPGLNVITAGNEWGKSTWCAFLTAMFYGLDTRAKSTKTTLADKEHYAPWSGSPMSGRIDLRWMGRDITIERQSTGRTPMGDFRAYETATGLELPEITAQNCGELLLGVERSVFVRTGFIRFRDISVTEDEALRRRLNNLVTTGEENSAADQLAEELKSLKNRIRHNKTGLLPQAEAQRDRLEETYRELLNLEAQNEDILRQLDSNEDCRRALENHLDALDYEASQEDTQKVAQAQEALQETWQRYESCDALCRTLPDRETAREQLDQINGLQDKLLRLQQSVQEIPREQQPVDLPEQFLGMTGDEAQEKAWEDAVRYMKIRGWGKALLILGLALLLAGAILLFFRREFGIACGVAAAVVLLGSLLRVLSRNRKLKELETFYGYSDPLRWEEMARIYAFRLARHNRETSRIRAQRVELEEEIDRIQQENRELGKLPRSHWEDVLAAWDARDAALEAAYRARSHYEDLKAMARTAKAPEFHDTLDDSRADTLRRLEECARERTRLENLRGQCRGSMEALGSQGKLEGQLAQVNSRIQKLEQTYSALLTAQETLIQARQELQQRFAPRITRRAGELLQAMTGGRYDRLRIGEDLSLWAGAAREDTLRDARWRSDGTVDQLYLALRLAVAEAMLPEIPLVLDDALVRFDDRRAKAAMDILRGQAQSRQVILFTCQSRENSL